MVLYRLRAAVLGVRSGAGEKPSLLTVPEGSTVQVSPTPASSAEMIRVRWRDVEVDVFRLDLDDRAERVFGISAD